MNVLLLGSGGREHAIAWKLNQSKKLNNLFIAPGNAGTSLCGQNVSISNSDFDAIGKFCLSNDVKMIVVGPEAPLVEGIKDAFKADSELSGITVIGPDKVAAQLEGSKEFAKEFMAKYNIPTAKYGSFTIKTIDSAFQFLSSLNAPYVLKADGLAAGKGVLILDSLEEAKKELQNMFNGKFGEASSTVVIEEFLDGIELSVFALTDGENYIILPEAKDYKRIGEDDTGLNTGGMGAVSPVPFANDEFLTKVEDQIVKPTINGFNKEGFDYTGFVFFGLMKVGENPFVIEYNVRMGDPETEVVIPRLKSDLLDLFLSISDKVLGNKSIEFDTRSAVTSMCVSRGYPENYEKGKEIIIPNDASENKIRFHAGTIEMNGSIITNGGRVISNTAFGNTLQDARDAALQMSNQIKFEGKYYRKDIGNDLL